MKQIFAICLITASVPAMSANLPICEQLARMADSGELWEHILTGRALTPEEEKHKIVETESYFTPPEPRRIYEIDEENGKKKYASYISPSWGTCSNFRIWGFDLQAHAITPEVEVSVGDESGDGVDLSDAGALDELVTVDTNSFVISTYYHFDRRTLKSAAIAKDGYIDQICKFTSEEQPKLVVRKAIDRGLCSRISQGELQPLPWDNHEASILLKTIYGTEEAPGKHLVTDLNMDGRSDMLGLFVDSSGGGCGSTNIYLASDDDDLNKLLLVKEDKLGRRGWGHNIYQDHYDTQVFIENGKSYILGNSELVSLWGNRQKTWCEFDSLTQHHVATVYKPVNH